MPTIEKMNLFAFFLIVEIVLLFFPSYVRPLRPAIFALFLLSFACVLSVIPSSFLPPLLPLSSSSLR